MMDTRQPTRYNAAHDDGQIEAMPGLRKNIELMWASRELGVFIEKSLLDGREGRQGFPVAVAEDMLFLLELNKRVRAHDMARKTAIELREAYGLIEQGDRAALQVHLYGKTLMDGAGSPWGEARSGGRYRDESDHIARRPVANTRRPPPSRGFLSRLFGAS